MNRQSEPHLSHTWLLSISSTEFISLGRTRPVKDSRVTQSQRQWRCDAQIRTHLLKTTNPQAQSRIHGCGVLENQGDTVTTCLLKTEQSRGLSERHNYGLLDFYLRIVSWCCLPCLEPTIMLAATTKSQWKTDKGQRVLVCYVSVNPLSHIKTNAAPLDAMEAQKGREI